MARLERFRYWRRSSVPPDSTLSIVDYRERQRTAALLDGVAVALKAKRSPRDVRQFARPENIVAIAEFLVGSWGGDRVGPAVALHTVGPYLVQRVAAHFGVVSFHTESSAIFWRSRNIFTIHDLRKIAARRSKRGARARLALATLGELHWLRATKAERAAWLYGQIIKGRAP